MNKQYGYIWNVQGWQARIGSRSSGVGCPYCAGKKVCEDNSLATVYPNVAEEWNVDKNESLTPNDVYYGSSKKVHWRCKQNHEWIDTIRHRTLDSRNCSICSKEMRKLATKENSFFNMRPEVARKFHPTKNIPFTVHNLKYMSKATFWFCCEEGHEWESNVQSMSLGKRCPICKK
ncbi:MAG: zinc-ribbon domain-containing protein [Psychrobacillus psychrodurans]